MKDTHAHAFMFGDRTLFVELTSLRVRQRVECADHLQKREATKRETKEV